MAVRLKFNFIRIKTMSTENENWRDASSAEESAEAGRDGNQMNRERNYSRPSYNREGGERPYRPRFTNENGERPQRSYGGDRPYRPRFNPNAENGEYPQRSYSGERPYRPRYNNEGNGRQQRAYGNATDDRFYRPALQQREQRTSLPSAL